MITTVRFRDVPFEEVQNCIELGNSAVWETFFRGRIARIETAPRNTIELIARDKIPYRPDCAGPWWPLVDSPFGEVVCPHLVEID